MLNLDNITLVAVSSVDREEHIKALAFSIKEIKFGGVLFCSDKNPFPKLDFYDFIKVKNFKNVEEWGYFIVFELYKYIKTDYILLIHADGFVVNPKSWTDIFFNYDYIGAPWPIPSDNITYRDEKNRLIRVGNSVSLRSYRLLEFPSKNKLKWTDTHGFFHEDGFICVKINHLLEEEGMRFAPIELAVRFSQETPLPEGNGIKPFVFHKWMGSNSNYPKFGSYNRFNFKFYLKKIKKLYAKII